jgi:hypothetical protein
METDVSGGKTERKLKQNVTERTKGGRQTKEDKISKERERERKKHERKTASSRR